MDLNCTAEEQSFAQEAADWLRDNIPAEPLPSGDTAEGFALHLRWEKQLNEARYAAVSWPAEYGGRDASLFEWCLFEETYYRLGAPARVTQNGLFLLAPTLFAHGTEEQKARFLPRIAAAEDLWCQGWSEPGAGSDLAALTSTATAVDGGFVLNGHKTWSTRGAFCNWMFGPFRTDPEAQRHRGLSYFLVPLDNAGVSVRGFARLDGDEGFADVFLDDVFVPDELVVGEVGEGWKVAISTASSERGLTLRSPGRFTATAQRLQDLYQRVGAPDDDLIRDAIARAIIASEAYRWYTYQTVTKMLSGESIGAEASMNKIFWSEMDVQMHETALRLLGRAAELGVGADAGLDDGSWMKAFQFSLAGPIYAGTNEIQRNVVAERVLGLPRK